jgi:membrane protein
MTAHKQPSVKLLTCPCQIDYYQSMGRKQEANGKWWIPSYRKGDLDRSWQAVKYYIVGLRRQIDEHHLLLAASGLAFALIVCIIPLVLIIFSLLGKFLEQPSIAGQIGAFIDRAVPYEDYANYVKDIVVSRVGEFTAFRLQAGWIGLVGLLFASSGLFSSMRTVLNSVYNIQRRQSVLIGKLRDLGLVLLVLAFVLVSTAILPIVDVITHAAGHIPWLAEYQKSFLNHFVVNMTSLSLIFVSFWVIYLLVPQRRQPQSVVLVSAVCSSVLWYAAKEAFGLYISHFITLKRIYGAYSLLIVVAFWIYYTAIVFIIGAEIGQLFKERHRDQRAERSRAT